MKEYELDKSTGEVTWKDDDLVNRVDYVKQYATKEEIELLNRLLDNYVLTSKNDGFKKCKLPYSEEFTYWYERIYCQSPSLCALQYDDEKMWEAWKEGYKLGRNNAYKRKDCPPEIFTIPKEKHIHTMNKDKDDH